MGINIIDTPQNIRKKVISLKLKLRPTISKSFIVLLYLTSANIAIIIK